MGRISEVTVLFADCRGFTALIHERGPEALTPLVDEFFRRCSDIVVGEDGILDNFRGDAVLAFFNVPIRRDDHVSRAVKAARRIQEAVPEINVAQGEDDLLKVGVGITTGIALTALVGSDSCKDYTVMGDVASIASRLQGLASPGEILVSEEVFKQVRSDHPDAPSEGAGAKGIGEPVKAYSLA